MPGTLLADGSAAADQWPKVEMNREDEPYRWRCPNNHCSWEPTNSHLWCPECRRENEAGSDVEAEHWEVLDKASDQLIPYSSIVIVEDK